MNSGRVVVVGSANTDMVVKSARLPGPGETVLGGEFSVLAGGKGANQAVAAARLGVNVTFIGCLGRDSLGDDGLEALVREGIDTRWVRRHPGAPSGVALIVVDERGENLIAVAPGANERLEPEDVEAALPAIEAADVVVAQLEVPVGAVERAALLARRMGKRFLLNPAPARPVPAELLRMVDYLTPNEAEARALLEGLGSPLAPQEDRGRSAAALLTCGVGCAIVTLGAEGVAVAAPDASYRLPAHHVTAVDSTAAGDAFTGALAAGLARGMAARAAIEFGIAAAALSVTRLGAQDSLPRREEVEALLRGR